MWKCYAILYKLNISSDRKTTTTKISAYNAGDLSSIRGSGRSPGEGNGSPLWYSCLENPIDRGAWQATVYGFMKSQTRLSDLTLFTQQWQTLVSAGVVKPIPCGSLAGL